jgi:hypothetical protein
MTMKEHLVGLHKRLSQHHLAKAGHHTKLGAHYSKLSEHLSKTETTEAQADSKSLLEEIGNMHHEVAAEHNDLAQHHLECCKLLKTAADDLNKLQPTQVSVVAPTRPTAVLRPGMRELQPGVSVEFSKIVGLDEADQHSEETSLQRH